MKPRQKVIFSLFYIISIQFISLYWGYHLGRTSRFSIFFDEEAQSRNFEASERKSEAASLAYLKSKETEPPQWPLHSLIQDPFCISIVTSKRVKAEYIIRSTAYLLSRLEATQYRRKDEPLPVKVYITNTARPKTDHKVLLTFGRAVDIIHIQDLIARTRSESVNASDTALEPSTLTLDSKHIGLRNEALDRGLMLEYAEDIGCQNLLILEDDGIVSKKFYTQIQEALDVMKSFEYFALKLFYSDTFTGWSKDPDNIFLLVVSAGIATVFFAIIPPIAVIYRFRGVKKWPCIILVIYFWVLYLGIFLAVGKQSLFPKYQGEGILKLGRNMGAIVGVVYPAKHFRGLSNFLKHKAQMMDMTPVKDWDKRDLKPVDIMIDDYADKVLNLDTYLLLPNVVQHVGRFSSSQSRNNGNFKILSQSNSFPKADDMF